jgi:hypothetical protein
MYSYFINSHKGIAVMPQLLKASNPPIPFRSIKECNGDYVIIFLGFFTLSSTVEVIRLKELTLHSRSG